MDSELKWMICVDRVGLLLKCQSLVFLFPMMKLRVTNNWLYQRLFVSVTATRKPDFVQWVVDNISTLDGKNTFHGMGIIAVSIGKSCNFHTRIPREKRKSIETTAGKAIPIKQYLHDGIKALPSIEFKSIKNLNICSVVYQV